MIDIGNSGCTIKFLSLEIENFGCIKSSKLSMEKESFSAQKIMGIYGQNGSGKSTLIRCLSFLRLLLCGNGIDDVEHYIRAGEDTACLKADFSIDTGYSKKLFTYSVKIKKQPEQYHWAVEEEKVYVSDINNLKNKLSFCYDASDSVNVITPLSTRNSLYSFLEKHINVLQGLVPNIFILLEKEKTRYYKSSYIFGNNLLLIYDAYCSENNESIFDYIKIMNEYAANYFFIITDNFVNDGIVKEDKIPVIAPNQKVFSNGALNYFAINLNGPTRAVEQKAGDFAEFLNSLNKSLSALCPETKIVAHKAMYMQPEVVNQNQSVTNFYEVFTEKDGYKIPLKYESMGIKKIISLINIMVFVYGNPSVFFVVDELDTSINEIVLDAFIKLFSESGKGQILFTSNNLHPLDLLDKSECYFTTTNPTDRFTHIKYLKTNNSLLNVYKKLAEKGDEKNSDLFNPITKETLQKNFEECFRLGN